MSGYSKLWQWGISDTIHNSAQPQIPWCQATVSILSLEVVDNGRERRLLQQEIGRWLRYGSVMGLQHDTEPLMGIEATPYVAMWAAKRKTVPCILWHATQPKDSICAQPNGTNALY